MIATATVTSPASVRSTLDESNTSRDGTDQLPNALVDRLEKRRSTPPNLDGSCGYENGREDGVPISMY
jgi:hypothetical protein